MHVASHTLSICQFLVVQAVYTSPIMVGIMDLIVIGEQKNESNSSSSKGIVQG